MEIIKEPRPAEKPALPPVADADGAAIAGLITAFVIPPLGIVFGAVSRAQARRKGERPSGVATAALVLGCLFTVIMFIVVIVVAASGPDPMQVFTNCVNQAIANGENPSQCPAP